MCGSFIARAREEEEEQEEEEDEDDDDDAMRKTPDVCKRQRVPRFGFVASVFLVAVGIVVSSSIETSQQDSEVSTGLSLVGPV